MPAFKTDVVIAGGGIGGTVLAALLVRGGRRVLIMEKAEGPPPFLRPELLWPAAAETLFSLRPREFWMDECLRPLGGITLDWAGQLRALVTPATLEGAGVHPFLTHPNRTRETLLAICGAEVRRGVEVVELLRDGVRVRGLRARVVKSGELLEVEAPLTIGDDGGASLARNGCGIDLKMHAFPAAWFTRGWPHPPGWDPAVVRILGGGENGLRGIAVMPLAGPEAAAVVLVDEKIANDEGALARAWARRWQDATEAPPELRDCGFPQGFTCVRRSWGHAARYGVEGAVLMGDALHPVTPAGGQGANMAIADAVVLARLILAGEPHLVSAYQTARQAANERGVRPSRMATQFFRFLRVPWLGRVPGVFLPSILQSQRLCRRLLRALGNSQR